MYVFWDLDQIFEFGKHKGKTFKDVLINNKYYIEWCIFEIKEFFLVQEFLDFITSNYKDYKLSEPAIMKNLKKIEIFRIENANNNINNSTYVSNESDDNDRSRGNWDAFDYLTGGMYTNDEFDSMSDPDSILEGMGLR